VVLEGVSLHLDAGQTVAFVGPSGAGKSTLSYLLSRLYTPTGGRVLLQGIDVADIPLQTLRRQISMVVQDNHLISGTVLENITAGDPHPSFERAAQAARLADAHEFITQLADGYSTALKEKGGGLSGGQRQRINIARALYREPAVLVLDEATASLDALSERNIVRNLKAMKHRPTTFIISHRINTVQHADVIVVLRAGRIIEQGSHAQLLERRGYYFRAWRSQQG
jgi:ABC-type multidrug transport system fused ATPase/permease subunit